MTLPRLLAAVALLPLLTACDTRMATPTEPAIEPLSSGDVTAVVDYFDTQFRALIKEEDLPSLSAAIVRSKGTIEYFSYGTRKRGHHAKITQDTLFQIASLSKLLTGIVTNNLIRSGELDPEAPTNNYLGPALGARVNTSFEHITTRQLLHHRSGIANEDCSLYAKRKEGEPWLDGYSRAELIDDLGKLSVSKREASNFDYSSCGYAIIGLIDELVSGQPFAALLNEHVAAKYEMVDTVVVLDTDQQSRLATPYRKDDRRVATQASDMGMGTPASAIYSSTRDLARLQAAQLSAYRNYALNGEDSDLLLSKRTAAGQRKGVRFGTGVIELRREQGTIYLHDGDADGFASLYAFAPEQDVGIVMLTGSGGRSFVELGIELLTQLMASESAVMTGIEN